MQENFPKFARFTKFFCHENENLLCPKLLEIFIVIAWPTDSWNFAVVKISCLTVGGGLLNLLVRFSAHSKEIGPTKKQND